MNEFQEWKISKRASDKLNLFKNFKLPLGKIEIIPNDQKDQKVATQLSAMCNFMMDSADLPSDGE